MGLSGAVYSGVGDLGCLAALGEMAFLAALKAFLTFALALVFAFLLDLGAGSS